MAITVSMTDAAKLLGVTRQQISTWHRRKDSNGFPTPVAVSTINDYRYKDCQWDPQALLDWHASYVPNKGGRPRKESN